MAAAPDAAGAGAEAAIGAPVVANVEVSNDRAVVHLRAYSGEGMLILFGSGTNRWTPKGVYLEAMFDVTMQPSGILGNDSLTAFRLSGSYELPLGIASVAIASVLVPRIHPWLRLVISLAIGGAIGVQPHEVRHRRAVVV